MRYQTLATTGALLAGYINVASALPQFHNNNGSTSCESVTTSSAYGQSTVLTGAVQITTANQAASTSTTYPDGDSTTILSPSKHEATVTKTPTVLASSRPTKDGLKDAACTFSGSQIVPTNVPTASPYVSTHGINYYPMGSQNGMILVGSTHPGWVFGPGQFPQSNSFELAAQECSDFCDTSAANGHGQCLSFNVFTVYEGDYNNCIPTFECRFSSSVYNTSDYYTDNGTPSYVWSLKSPEMPSCPLDVPYSPALWVSTGMDDWLVSFTRANDIYSTTSEFMEKLMSLLKWDPYDCNGPLAADAGQCVDVDNSYALPCANWVNRQADLYFTYIDQMYKTYNTWQAFMGNQGPVVYESFWNKNPPPSASFNYESVVETTFNSILGCIPDFGSVIQGIAEIGESIYAAIPTNTPVPGPSQSSTWNSFISIVSQSMSSLASQIVGIANVQGATGTILDVMKNGVFFLNDADSVEINADALWANYKPFFDTQVAVAAMKAQGVFLLRAPISGVSASTCTQAVADRMAAYINSDDTTNTAWCDTDGAHVVIPVNGWNMDVYRVFNSVSQVPLNLTVTEVGTSAIECFPDFSPTNNTISPYGTRPMTGFDFMSGVPDLTSQCVWPLPVCDYDTWATTAVTQSETEGGIWYNNSDYYPLVFGDELGDVAQWCSFQFGFRSEINWCGEDNWCDPPYGCEKQRQCTNYKWTKKFNVV